MRALKICIYCHQYNPFQGGVQTSTTHLAKHLADRGHEIIVATATPKDDAWDLPFTVVYRPSPGQLAHIFRTSDIVHCQGFALFPMLLALLSCRPVVWSHHDYDLLCPKGVAWQDGPCRFAPGKCFRNLQRDHPPHLQAGLVASYLVRRFLAHHPRIRHLSHSEFMRQSNGPQSSAMLYYGIAPLSGNLPGGPPPEVGPHGAPVFAFVGRLIPEKGCHVLLEALAAPALDALGARAIIIGDGPEREALRDHTGRLGISHRVTFLGHLSGSALWMEVTQSTAVVVPSVWDEPFGMVALEAMDLGVPVVASRAGGLSESAGQGGLLFERGNANALARVLQDLAGDATLRRMLSEGGRMLAGQHHWRRMAVQYERFYSETLDLPGP